MSVKPHQAWLARASDDLKVAHLVLDEGYFSHVCFLAQQCIEKSLKAYLIANKNAYPRTHKLVDLLTACTQSQLGFHQFRSDCAVVDLYYIPTRYPDSVPGSLPSGLPSKVEAQEAVKIASNIFSYVQQQI